MVLEQVGQTMTAQGWVANIRNHGKLAFIELRDREGLLQVLLAVRLKILLSWKKSARKILLQ